MKSWSPAPKTIPPSSTPNAVTAAKATVSATAEACEMAVCHGGIGCVSPRRCCTVLTTNAAAATIPAITAIG
ncbi:hypothetical protein [Microbacterium sp. NPDC056052]|uniref:hypothetical protein n=1 Tax=Microbacterium sp. NPDC056052 TaxID=3345695 RepID=UPI0035DAA7D6